MSDTTEVMAYIAAVQAQIKFHELQIQIHLASIANGTNGRRTVYSNGDVRMTAYQLDEDAMHTVKLHAMNVYDLAEAIRVRYGINIGAPHNA